MGSGWYGKAARARRLRASVVDAYPLSGLPGPGALQFIQRRVEVGQGEEAGVMPHEWQMRKMQEDAMAEAGRHARFLAKVGSG